MFLEAGFESVEDFFASNFIQTMNQCNSSPHLFISIGSGNCDLEISIGEILLERGYHNFSIECMEINADMLERGKALAKQKGLTHIISFSRNDFNQWLSNKTYDGIMANHSLHHVLNIEHLFDQIKKSLHPKGRFIINDMIGRNGHQRWPEALEIVNSFWKELPSEYRYNTILERYEEDYENWDCSIEGFEGIRAQDILPLLMESFHCHKFLGFGNVVDIFVDRCFGHHFNPDFEWDRNFIDRLHETDEAGFREGRLTPTHMLAVFVKELSSEPYYVRGLDPWSSIRDI
jgi:SAM-dependent methyltransferase